MILVIRKRHQCVLHNNYKVTKIREVESAQGLKANISVCGPCSTEEKCPSRHPLLTSFTQTFISPNDTTIETRNPANPVHDVCDEGTDNHLDILKAYLDYSGQPSAFILSPFKALTSNKHHVISSSI